MLIKIIAQRDFIIFFNLDYNYNKLCGCETLYPEDIQLSLIETLICKNINNFCFEINQVCLHPKYTFDDKEIFAISDNKYIVISDEIYDKYFNDCDTNFYKLNIIYDLPKTDIIKLKRISGDFPQDGSIDILLTKYLEKSIVINSGQEFTLYFDCNYSAVSPMVNSVNFITFEINEIIYLDKINKDIHKRLQEMELTIEFNKKINKLNDFITFDKCENNVYNFNWLQPNNQKNNYSFIANSEVKIDFIVTEIINPKVELPINNNFVSNLLKKEQTIDTIENICEEKNINVLTREELRKKRLEIFDKII
jgi:hypothetical protein